MKTLTTLAALPAAWASRSPAAARRTTPSSSAIGGPITGSDAAFGRPAEARCGARRSPTSTTQAASRQEDQRQRGADDVGDPRQGVSVANNFVAAGVKYVVGHFNSSR